MHNDRLREVGRMRSIREILDLSPDCEGEPCWYNQETGQTEFCVKHNGMLLDADHADRTEKLKAGIREVS